MRTTSRNTLQSLAHAVELLELLREHPRGLSLTELSRLLSLSKPSTARILRTLLECRYLAKSEDAKYGLGAKLWQLGCAAIDRNSSLRESAAPVLRDLAVQTNETANLGVYDRGRVLYVDSVESEQPLRLSLKVGSSSPAYCVASGKALLAFQPPEEIESVIRSGLRAYTPKTIASAADLKRELATIRATGVARNLGEYQLGVAGVAVPVVCADGRVPAAISIAGPLMRLSGQRMRAYEALLREGAAEVAGRLGGAETRAEGRAATTAPARLRSTR